jgi:hypothetical protein
MDNRDRLKCIEGFRRRAHTARSCALVALFERIEVLTVKAQAAVVYTAAWCWHISRKEDGQSDPAFLLSQQSVELINREPTLSDDGSEGSFC